jgi:hypothetical protein
MLLVRQDLRGNDETPDVVLRWLQEVSGHTELGAPLATLQGTSLWRDTHATFLVQPHALPDITLALQVRWFLITQCIPYKFWWLNLFFWRWGMGQTGTQLCRFMCTIALVCEHSGLHERGPAHLHCELHLVQFPERFACTCYHRDQQLNCEGVCGLSYKSLSFAGADSSTRDAELHLQKAVSALVGSQSPRARIATGRCDRRSSTLCGRRR